MQRNKHAKVENTKRKRKYAISGILLVVHAPCDCSYKRVNIYVITDGYVYPCVFAHCMIILSFTYCFCDSVFQHSKPESLGKKCEFNYDNEGKKKRLRNNSGNMNNYTNNERKENEENYYNNDMDDKSSDEDNNSTCVYVRSLVYL